MVADRAVACVVEDEDDRAGAFPDGRLQLGAGHPQATVADERDDRPARRGKGRRDGGREAVAHRSGAGPEVGARPADPEAPRRPAAEVAGVGGDDGVRGQRPLQRRDHAAGVHARPVPRRGVHDASLQVGGAVGGVRLPAPLQRRHLQDRASKQPARLANEGPRIRGEGNGRSAQAGPRAEGLDVDVGPGSARRRNRPAVGRHLVEATAQHEQAVGLPQAGGDGGGREVAAHPEVEGVVVGEDVGPTPGRDDGQVEHLGEAHQVRRGARAEDARPGQDHGALRVEQQVQDPADGDWVRLGRARRAEDRRGGDPPGVAGRGLVEEVRRQAEEDRPWAPRRRLPEGLVERPRQGGDVADLAGPAAEPAERRHEVDLLERLAAPGWPVDLAHDGDERRRIRVGDMEGDRQVRGADGARHHDDRRAARQGAVGGRHEAGAAFVTGGHDADSRGDQPIQERQEALPGDRVGNPDPGGGQGVGHEAAGVGLGFAHVSGLRAAERSSR